MSEVKPDRSVLKGVPKVEFYSGGERCPEDFTFPSCLRACLEYLGQPLGCKFIETHNTRWRLDCGYAYLMGTSGSAFKLSWRPGWHPDNVEISYMSDDPTAPYRRAFESIGLAFDFMHKDAGEAQMTNAILNAVALQRRPVLAFGVIGPPECCIVTGYDDGGDTLIGWNFYQNMPEFSDGLSYEPTGEFRKNKWFAATEALILIGEQGPSPDKHDTLLGSLRWALHVSRVPVVSYCERINGHAAYAKWAEQLIDDSDFPADDLPTLRKRYEVHDDAVGSVAEGRWYATEFLKMMANWEPAIARELLSAAKCYVAEHDLMWKAWAEVGGNARADENVLKLASSKVRKNLADIILEAREQDIQACVHLEHALHIAGHTSLR